VPSENVQGSALIAEPHGIVACKIGFLLSTAKQDRCCADSHDTAQAQLFFKIAPYNVMWPHHSLPVLFSFGIS
jgi:hypothetical protein